MAHNKVTVVLFSLLCISTVTYSTQSTEYIAKLIDKSIATVFTSIDSNVINELIRNIANSNATNFETSINSGEKTSDSKFYYSGVNVSILYYGYPEAHFDFATNKLVIFNSEFTVRVEGYLGAVKEIALAGFIRSLDFTNITIKAQKSPENISDDKFQISITYDDVNFNYIYLPWFQEYLTPEEQQKLADKIERTLPLVLLDNINQNEHFLEVLNRTFTKQMFKREMALSCSDFFNHEEKFYYRAQNVSSFRVTLGNITVKGLMNFVSVEFDRALGYPTNTLEIENVRGKALLRYDGENSTAFELDFETERISMSVNNEMQRVYVEARNYSVIDTKRNVSLTESQSGWIMEGIGQAIAASTLPSMKICRSKAELSGEHETVHPLMQLFTEISEKFHWNIINESYSQWTPFDGNYTTTKMNFDSESHKYNISIHNLILDPGLSTHYPYQVECYFFETLKVVYYIEGSANGTIRLQNSANDTVDIDFQARLSFADQIIKREPNGAHEFKMWLAFYSDPISITLCLLPANTNYTLEDSDILEITNIINDTLISMTREIMLHNSKPLLSSRLDLCMIPNQIVDNFLPPFADYQVPYVAEGKGIYGGRHFTSKIYNISLNGLSHFDLVRVAFNRDDMPNFISSSSSEEDVGSFVEFPIYNITGRMNFNDSSVKFNELLLERLDELSMVNATNTGMISLFPSHKYKITPVPEDPRFSCHDSMWIMEKIEDIVENSLSKKSDDFSYPMA